MSPFPQPDEDLKTRAAAAAAGAGSYEARGDRVSVYQHSETAEEPRFRIGELLVEAGLITAEQRDEALRLQKSWGSRLGDIVLAMGWVKPLRFYETLAAHFGLDFVNLIEQPPDETLFMAADYGTYAQHLFLPWRKSAGVLSVATAEPDSQDLRNYWRGRTDVCFVMTSKFDILWELQRVAGPEFSKQAVFHLAHSNPQHSAQQVVTRPQKIVGLVGAIALALTFYWQPLWSAIVLNAALNSTLLICFLFRAFLCWLSCSENTGMKITHEEVQALSNADLPIYSVLVPMFKEPDVLPILAGALRRMDYPRSKLDIKLVLEDGDYETIQAAKDLALDATFEIIRVPRSQPQTKPKACNYALRLARGKYLTIYDAEDKPEPDQLKKAVAAFNRLGELTACVQSRLNYFNPEENWLTRMFTLEYSLWFEMFLPALDRMQMPIPLGGTSNHFDIAKLREVGGWDPFNVTEDADLGMRFAALGYRVGMVNSVTYEEANTRLGNWIRQRSRWLKGYMQTWLVNMRHPLKFFREVKSRGLVCLHLFVGGAVLSGLAYPFMMIPFIIWVITGTSALKPFYPYPVFLIGITNLTVGIGCLVYLSMLAAAKRKHWKLVWYALTTPVYWFLHSVAAYKGLWQLATNPFYWEKTVHGLSKLTTVEIAQAASQS
jgi:cellulose synthase/poly-beta-1,6-N-acetylglucosamine synthase-like glycosyltransferase